MSTATFTKTYIKPPEQKNMKNVQKHDPQPFMFVRERTQQAIGDATEKRSLNIRSYILKTVSTKGAQEIESTRNLSRREYEDYLRFEDPERFRIKQRRVQFSYKDQFYEIVEYLEPKRIPPLLLLNVHQNKDEKLAIVDIPDFLSVKEDVTLQSTYSAHMISKRNLQDTSPMIPPLARSMTAS